MHSANVQSRFIGLRFCVCWPLYPNVELRVDAARSSVATGLHRTVCTISRLGIAHNIHTYSGIALVVCKFTLRSGHRWDKNVQTCLYMYIVHDARRYQTNTKMYMIHTYIYTYIYTG